MTAAAVVVATTTPKRHGFSIESLIGRRDDSPGRRPHSGVLAVRASEERGVSDRDRVRDRDYSWGSAATIKEGVSEHVAKDFTDTRAREGRRSTSSPRQGTASPSSTDDERSARVPSPAHSTGSSPTGSTSSSGLDKSLSPESENRLGLWSREDFKHLLVGGGAFGPHHPHHTAHHHHHPHPGHALAAAAAGDPEGPGLYQQPLRVCNRSLAAAMTSLMGPNQGLGALPVNPLLYSLHRDIAHQQSAHSLLAARYSGFMHPRYPIGPPPGLLFHPYRKPKRNRTAFSPSQLLQLEQAFEKNHYVVGQERKTLASKLQLTETQVKVWFQNRRTKHKRMKAEEEASGGVTSGDDVNAAADGAQSDAKSDASEHEMEDEVCTSDDEELSVTDDS